MKLLLVLLCMNLGISWLAAQDKEPDWEKPDVPDWFAVIPRPGDYLDPVLATATFWEANMLKNWRSEHGKASVAIDSLWPTVVAEYLARRKISPAMPPVLFTELTVSGPLSEFHNICTGFIGQPLYDNRKARLCKSKKAFLIRSARLVDDFTTLDTKFNVNAGVCEQIEEKYSKIMNKIVLELYEMKKAKDRRTLISQLRN